MSQYHYAPVVQQYGLGWLIVRLLYFFFFGLWFSGIWAAIAWVLSITIIGLPIGLWMLHHLPQVATLRPERHNVEYTPRGEIYLRNLPQPNFFIRAIYFLLVGWWLSALWLTIAWALCAVLIGIPIGFWMIDRVPAIMTLART